MSSFRPPRPQELSAEAATREEAASARHAAASASGFKLLKRPLVEDGSFEYHIQCIIYNITSIIY